MEQILHMKIKTLTQCRRVADFEITRFFDKGLFVELNSNVDCSPLAWGKHQLYSDLFLEALK